MDQYSLPKLKKAATEPEHAMRKAEFDQMVERIATIEKSLGICSGDVVRCRIDSMTIFQLYLLLILFGTNLPAVVTKVVEGVLHIIYRLLF